MSSEEKDNIVQETSEGSSSSLGSSSRKREREISQEPPTFDAKSIEDPTSPNAPKSPRSKRRSPKKNRVGTPRDLDDTQEEEPQQLDNVESGASDEGDNQNQMVISVSGSPPHETKMRQISEGVGGMKVKRKLPVGEDVFVEGNENGNGNSIEPFPCSADQQTARDEAKSIEQTPMLSTSPVSSRLRASGSSFSEDMDQDKMLKRKLGDRAVSESREAESLGKKASRKAHGDASPTKSMAAAKRSRENSDKDLEIQRPSPPLEKNDAPEASSSKPKSTGFMAYAGSSSPFASANGPNVFGSSKLTTDTSETATKRPRDDADKDDNPRETKRPSPPPEKTTQEPQPSGSTSSSGFLAFASTSSPFAKVKGPNLFAKSSSPWSGSASPSPSTPAAPTPKKTGFEGFASPSSPFGRSRSPVGAFGRSKSPSGRKPTSAGVTKNSNAFSAYTSSGAQGFAAVRVKSRATTEDVEEKREESGSPAPVVLGTKSEEEKEREKMSFGDRLRAEKDGQGSGDDDDKVVLTEQELHTGEEDEETVYQVRGKLFSLNKQNQWQERGTGIIKLNLRKSDGEGARLVMRKDAVYTVLLNATLFKGMSCSFAPQDQRYLKFSTFEDGSLTHYNLRLANAKIAAGLLEEVKAHIPSS